MRGSRWERACVRVCVSVCVRACVHLLYFLQWMQDIYDVHTSEKFVFKLTLKYRCWDCFRFFFDIFSFCSRPVFVIVVVAADEDEEEAEEVCTTWISHHSGTKSGRSANRSWSRPAAWYWLIDWLIDWLIAWLTNWLIDWFLIHEKREHKRTGVSKGDKGRDRAKRTWQRVGQVESSD